jgi:hypothetical protein
MTPGRPFITALAPLPFAPGITARSIIAISGDGPMQNGDDGVVQYSRAHLGAAVSELVERSGHSSQSNLRTIAEVRRILRLHLQESCAADVGCGCPAAAPSSEQCGINRESSGPPTASKHIEGSA